VNVLTFPRRRSAIVLLAGALVMTGFVVNHAEADDEGTTATDRNVDILQRARRQAANHEYSGIVKVRWLDANGTAHSSETHVRYDHGVVEVGTDGHVVSTSTDAFVLDGAPRADAKYTVTRAQGPIIAKYPTTQLDARRDRDGELVERFYVNERTGLVLGRESYDDASGAPRRELEFAEVWPDALHAGLGDASDASSASQSARRIEDVDAPYRAPGSAGDGFRLVARYERPGPIVQLTYSDGLLSASVFEQPGRLNWDALPAGGHAGDVDGHPAVMYSLPVGDAIVWEHGGVVYTSVGDVPAADLFGIAVDVSRGNGNGGVTRMARTVLAPFGW
jgi:sigma-E factor negative regulatory protein RseB